MKLSRIACLVLMVLIAACGGDDDGLSPASYTGTWTGTTSQARSFSFTVTSAGITSLTLNYHHDGTSCDYDATVNTSGGPPVPINNGQFGANGIPLGANATLNAAGTFTSASAASGNASITDSFCGGATNISWTASR